MMAAWRGAFTAAGAFILPSVRTAAHRTISLSAQVYANKVRWVAPLHRELKRRHDKMLRKMKEKGEVPNYRRSGFIDWNYNAELYAFGKRLQEEFDGDALREALTHASYIHKETQRQQELGVSDPALAMAENSQLAAKGEQLIGDYCTAYLRASLPLLPEEGVSSLVEYLLSEDVMSEVGFGIGLKDLVLCEEYPPSPSTMARCFQAVVGALNESSPGPRCQAFIRDFVAAQLVGKDVDTIWKIENPKGVLADILHNSGRGEPEPRLIFQSGRTTLQAVYQVGVYSDKQFMGSGYGETVEIAVEEATHDALRRLFHITEAAPPLPFGKKADALPLKSKSNIALEDWSLEKAKNVFVC